MATKKSVKKTSKKSVKPAAKKAVKKTAKKSVGSSSSKSKPFEEMPESPVYRSPGASESLPPGVPEKKSSLTVYIVAGVLLAVSIFFVYRTINRKSAEQEMTEIPAPPVMEAPAAAEPAPAAEVPPPPAATETPAAVPEANTYTVRAGDSLYGIAKSQLGNPKRSKEILELNPEAKVLKPGMTLKMPAK